MKPITEPILVAPSDSELPAEVKAATDTAASGDIAEIEQIVKERMEQHREDTRERNSSTSSGTAAQQQPPRTPVKSTSSTISAETSATTESGGEDQSSTASTTPVDPETTALTKRQFVIRELVETERDYVNDLRLIVEGYLGLMRDPNTDVPLPDDLKAGKDKMVFGNIEAIFEWHRE